MLDVIALIFLCRKIGNLAVRKGLKSGIWKWYTVLAWITGELIGVMLGFALSGPDNIFGILLLGILSAFGGYLFIKYTLEQKPDAFDEDINRIGVDDLHPPGNNQ